MTKENEETKTCMRCGRVLENDDKFGLCATCVNKFGSPAIVFGAIAVGGAIKKFGPRVAELFLNLVKR